MFAFMKNFLFCVFLVVAIVKPEVLRSGDFVSPDDAFKLTVKTLDSKTISATWQIAQGFHLYKDQLSIEVAEKNGTELGQIILPDGIKEHEENLGDFIVYKGVLSVDIPVKTWGKGSTNLLFKYQGCEDNRRCYPPISKVISVMPPTETSLEASLFMPTLHSVTELLQKRNIPFIVIGFFIFGILLSLTPCVLPMVPILAGIIIGQKDIKTIKAFLLSLTYVLGMAATYTIAGIITAKLGSSVQALLQNFWVILLCSLIFIFLALSLFGVYELQLPSSLMNKLNTAANKTKGGSFLGVFAMGIISSLVVSPCVSAPLAGALVYIASTGNVVLGGLALFSLSLGMGVLLVIAGTAGGKLFLKAGNWMNVVKFILGLAMLAIAIWMISRVISETITDILWTVFFIGTGIYIGLIKLTSAKLKRSIIKLMAILFFFIGIGIFFNSFFSLQLKTNSQNRATSSASSEKDNLFINVVKSEKELQHYIEQAKFRKKPLMLDFYADWCISCKEMDVTTFRNTEVRSTLQSFVIVRADVTENNNDTESLMKKYGVFAPPYIIFFTPSGEQISKATIAGAAKAQELLIRLNSILAVYSTN